MSGSALWDELDGYALALTGKQILWLWKQGLAFPVRDRGRYIAVHPEAGPVGAARAAVCADGIWEPQPDGTPVLVFAVADDPFSFTADGASFFETIVDLVAFNPKEPDVWWRRNGCGRWLGEGWIELARDRDVDIDLRFFATPADWLKGRSRGVCLLEPFVGLDVGGRGLKRGGERLYLRETLWGVENIVCDDYDHAARLDAALDKLPPRPARPVLSFNDEQGRAA